MQDIKNLIRKMNNQRIRFENVRRTLLTRMKENLFLEVVNQKLMKFLDTKKG